jgi:hypothetical protein
VSLFLAYFCLSMGSLIIGLVFRFLCQYVGGKLDVYKWTGKNDYVALCEPEYLSFGCRCVTFSILFIYCVKLWNCILFLTGTVGMDYTSTTRSSTGLRLTAPHSRTNRFVHRVRGRVGTSLLSVWGWKCGQ